MTRSVGVFQRCRPECSANCRRHRWAFTVELGTDASGRRRQMTKGGFETQREARHARDRVISQYRSGALAENPRQTVSEYLHGWLERKKVSGSIRETTARSYEQHIATYLNPMLGRIRLATLRPADLEEMFLALAREGAGGRPLSPATLRRIHATLRSALRDAVRRGDLATDPSARITLPRAPRVHVHPWEPQVFGAFLDAIEGHRLMPLFLLAGMGGLRRGELCGLRWADVDLDRSRLVVRQQLVVVGHRTMFAPPKTAGAEERVVDLDSATVSVLRGWRARQASERLAWSADYHETGLVFTQENGLAWHPETITKTFPRLARGAGVKPCRLHDLRHLQASLMLSAGVPLSVVSKRLGHSSVGITADTYQHLLDGVGRDAAERAASLVPRAGRTAS